MIRLKYKTCTYINNGYMPLHMMYTITNSQNIICTAEYIYIYTEYHKNIIQLNI